MTSRDRSVDWDRLADHLGGAVAGTPEEVEVARLVATDPGWARAATELSTAFDAVAADLRSLPEPTLPEEVAARLDAVLRATGTVPAEEPPATQLPGKRATGAGTPAPGGRAAGEDRRPPGRPPRRSRRRRVARWGAGFAVAAGVAVFAAVGFAIWSPTNPQFSADGGGADQDRAQEQTPQVDQPVVGQAGGPAVVATGTDYQTPTVGTGEPEVPERAITGEPELGTADNRDPVAQPPQSPTGEDRVPDLVPPGLAWLWVDPAARERCLELIREALGPPPVTIQTVDFAQFEGEDALMIWATVADQTRMVWVSGPECGAPGAGPDELFQDQLG